MAERKKNPRFVTPKGIQHYPYFTAPDTKFNANGEYKTEAEFPADAQMFDSKGKSLGKIVDYLNQAIADSVEKFGEEYNGKKKKGKTIEVEEAADAPFYVDGDKLFVKFKLKAFVEPTSGDSFTQAPVLFDSKGKKLNLKQNPWTGTIAKINFEVVPYYNAKDAQAGVTLRLKAVQIIDAVFGGGANADEFGFGEEEGFEAGDEPEDEGNTPDPYADQDDQADRAAEGDEDGDEDDDDGEGDF